MPVQDDLTLDLVSGPPATGAATASPREVHVLLFTPRREALLQRIDVPGLPHAGAWTATVVAPV
ncbi:MAG TPA: hypothetical protein VHH36_02160, partial [Candidatus Thermoplasmatota archaeon]|nr:hypothetical protein [Candidatus Thermoplasmatota archaeon]